MTQTDLSLSPQGQQLIEQYKQMAEHGYDRADGSRVEQAYNDFELRRFRDIVKPSFERAAISTVLDYGGGGSDWSRENFDPETGQSAKDYFGVSSVQTFEPARDLLVKSKADAVVCMDVLEHVFLVDVIDVIRELFSLAEKVLIINVACYKASAILPCGENAHITIRDREWWKGVVDTIALDYPDVEVLLMCSSRYDCVHVYETWKSGDWRESDHFSIEQNSVTTYGKQTSDITLSPDQILEFVDLLARREPKMIAVMADLLKKHVDRLEGQ